jgi:hypothetical protein
MAPDEGYVSANTERAEADPSPVTNALRASVPPSPTGGEGKNLISPIKML